jgi:DNA-directed RNA polymerase specialized sigma24 family protein
MTPLFFPPDMTAEEIILLSFVKQHMLMKLSDRGKFLFLYCIEMGHDQREAATVLQVNETSVSRDMKKMREILSPFKKGYEKKTSEDGII